MTEDFPREFCFLSCHTLSNNLICFTILSVYVNIHWVTILTTLLMYRFNVMFTHNSARAHTEHGVKWNLISRNLTLSIKDKLSKDCSLMTMKDRLQLQQKDYYHKGINTYSKLCIK